jgi:hypothetical protein
MEFIGVALAILGLYLLVIGFIVDDYYGVFVGAIFFILGLLLFIFSSKPHNDGSITIQEIEYAMNKCSSFGGLKEFRDGVIICMDKTEIKLNFEPVKKVEVE